jgi:hypothetical protein
MKQPGKLVPVVGGQGPSRETEPMVGRKTEEKGRRSRETEGDRLIQFKGLDHMIVGAGKSEICRQASRLEIQAGFLCYITETEFLLL